MKKAFILIGVCLMLAGCATNLPKANPAQQACLAARPMIAQIFDVENKTSLEGEGEGGVCNLLDVIYSTSHTGCYAGYTCDGDAHMAYMIAPITIQGSGFEYGEQEIVDTCVSFDGLIQANNPELTGVALDKAERESLCKYREEAIQARYKKRIQELGAK